MLVIPWGGQKCNHAIHLTPTCAGFRKLAIANQAPAFIKFSGRGRGR